MRLLLLFVDLPAELALGVAFVLAGPALVPVVLLSYGTAVKLKAKT